MDQGLAAGKSAWFPFHRRLSRGRRGGEDVDATRRGVVDGSVHALLAVRAPGVFRGAPTDGLDVALFGRLVDGVDETLLGVGREVDADVGVRRNGTDDVDVQRDLAVRSVGAAGRRIVGAVHPDGGDVRSLDAVFEILIQIGVLVAAAQLDNADGLALAVGAREVVATRHLRRRVALDEALGAAPHHGLHDGVVVEPEHGLDVVAQRGQAFFMCPS